MLLDLREISTFTDFFVICSGTSEPHLKAIAGEIETRLREDHDVRPAASAVFHQPVDCARFHHYNRHIFNKEKRGSG